VTFENEDVVDRVCDMHFHEINNKMVSANSDLFQLFKIYIKTRNKKIEYAY